MVSQVTGKKEIESILIIEDDEIVRTMLAEILKRHYQVDTLAFGRDSLKTLLNKNYDLLLMDVRLPDVNGFEILQALRQEETLAELPVILISGRFGTEDVVQGLELGANDYIPKPVETKILLARIETQLKLKRLQDERKRYISNLEESERIRTQFSRIASHDLKSPLNNLRMAEQLLREETAFNARAQQLLNTVEASLEMMQNVISAFLDLVAIQSQNLNLNSNPIRLRDVVNHALTQYEILAENKNIKIHLGAVDSTILGDSPRMIQVVGNLVSNAIKYSPPDAEVRIWIENKAQRIRLNVADKGAGIPKEERHLLFREFSKLSTRPTAGESSTGLGLWIVKHLMELQGGTAGADFPESGGSVFWIEMLSAKNTD